MNEYCTLTELRRVILPSGAATTDDVMLQRMLEDAARWIDQRTRLWFYPKIETRYYDYPARNPAVLQLDAPLLAVTTLTTENAAVTVANSDYYLRCGDDYNRTPYDRILLKDNGTQVTFEYAGSIQKSQAVTGTWGYHEEYSTRAWESSNDTLKTSVNASATTIAVNDADGADLWGITPRFQAGHIVKLDDELMYVTAVTAATTNTLTVIRGWNGSTAATHTAGITIYIWRPMPDVFRATLDLAAWLYRHKDVSETGQVAYPSLGVTLDPDKLPQTVRDVLVRYKRVSL